MSFLRRSKFMYVNVSRGKIKSLHAMSDNTRFFFDNETFEIGVCSMSVHSWYCRNFSFIAKVD